jgi:prevent-host-death family protein
MTTIGVRELRQKASYYLSRVAAGERVDITDRGRPVARLVPITRDSWQDMVDAGEVTPASSGIAARDFQPVECDAGGSAALEALRTHER